MQRWFLVLFLFVCQAAVGQISLNTCLQWFDKADQKSVTSYFQDKGYRLLDEKDSLDLHVLHYSMVKTENGVHPHVYTFLKDSTVEYLSFEIFEQSEFRSIFSQLKGQHFKMLNADVNGNFITTVYDNNRFLLNQDYEAIENPLAKGQIPYYRFRLYRKNGKFDELNGEKIVELSENGIPYPGIQENYTNGFLSGERILYYPDGTIKRKENYQGGNGRLSGLTSDYDKDGKITHSVTYSYHWKYGMEKWYNAEGKVVKTLQWQRDVPVGAEKQTFNGTVVGNIPYVKGLQQGLAKVPIYADPFSPSTPPLDTLNDAPIAIETVNYDKGLKTGKAVGISFHSSDTLYTGYYKAGKLDSTFTHYEEGNVWYTTTFTDGVENGTRIYRIPSGPLKDTVYKIEHCKNGKLDGLAEQFYSKSVDEILEDPDPEFHLQSSKSGYPKTVLGDWAPNHSFETYKDGVRNGPYLFREDSMNYNKGNYVNGKLDSLQESGIVLGGKCVKMTRYYDMNIKVGEWITEYVSDSVVVTEHYTGNRKHGFETRVVKGELAEERLYNEGTLTTMKWFDHGIESRAVTIQNQTKEEITITELLKTDDTKRFLTYRIPKSNFPKSDTLLATLSEYLKDPEFLMLYISGKFTVETKDYEQNGMLLGHNVEGTQFIRYKKEGITEAIEFESGQPKKHVYMTRDGQPYSGTFISSYSDESISVKDGLRHGWCIEYDKNKTEIRRTKYSKGVVKKTIRKSDKS